MTRCEKRKLVVSDSRRGDSLGKKTAKSRKKANWGRSEKKRPREMEKGKIPKKTTTTFRPKLFERSQKEEENWGCRRFR